MVVRGSGGVVAAAVGAAAAAGAAQLGLGYGMDIISWPTTAAGAQQTWAASLTWAAWITASATIIGAIVAERLAAGPRPAPTAAAPADLDPARPAPNRPAPAGGLRRLLLAGSAAVGAAATAVLVAVPARVADLTDTPSPQLTAGGYGLLGALLGLLFAAGALAARAVAANLLATGGWLWLLAAAAVTDGVLAGRDWERVPLAFWEASPDGPWYGNVLLPDAGLALAAALLVGVLAAVPAARRGDHPAGVVISGAAGPLLVAAAYLLTQPDLVQAGAVELSRQLVAPYLVVTGLLGSLLALAVPRRSSADPEPGSDSGGGPVAGIPAARDEHDEPVGERV